MSTSISKPRYVHRSYRETVGENIILTEHGKYCARKRYLDLHSIVLAHSGFHTSFLVSEMARPYDVCKSDKV